MRFHFLELFNADVIDGIAADQSTCCHAECRLELHIPKIFDEFSVAGSTDSYGFTIKLAQFSRLRLAHHIFEVVFLFKGCSDGITFTNHAEKVAV